MRNLKKTNIRVHEKDPNKNYQSLTKIFVTFLNKHAPLKKENCVRKSGPLYD